MKRKEWLVLLLLFIVLGVFVYMNYKPFGKSKTDDSGIVPNKFENVVDMDRIPYSEYMVVEGDTIESIAEEYGLEVETILFANDYEIGQELVLGELMRIPAGDGIIIEVKEGDTLESLAENYEVDAQDIADFNWLDVPYTLTVGMVLFIPKAL
jgi:LysM repeat protein